MIKFRKGVSRLLPYNRRLYKKYLFSDPDVSVKWYGISFQLPSYADGGNVTYNEFLQAYRPFFERIISKFNDGCSWIINHDKGDLEWFPEDGHNLPKLRKLFAENNIQTKFKGALVLSTAQLLTYSAEIVSYPYIIIEEDGWFYTDLDISHSKLPFVIKILDHLTIEILSTEIKYLREISKETYSSDFCVFEWIGTTL